MEITSVVVFCHIFPDRGYHGAHVEKKIIQDQYTLMEPLSGDQLQR